MNLHPNNIRKVFNAEWVGEKLFQAYLVGATDPPQSGQVEGFLHPMEERCLQWAAAQAPAGGKIVEVGSYQGKSAINLAHAIRRKISGAHLYCVDTWLNDTIEDAVGRDVFNHFQENTSAFSDLITPLRGRSAEVGARWNRGPIDVLFIDGDHSYGGLRQDIESWIPHVAPGGVILFHDTDIPDVDRCLRDSMGILRPTRSRKVWSIRLFWKG